jgi:EipB-like
MDHLMQGVSRVLKRLLLASAVAAVAQSAMAASVVPHRAIYDLQMLRSNQGVNLDNVSGRMAYEVTGSECDGWSVSFRLVNSFQYKEGESRLFDTQSTSWETGDGKDLNYTEKEFIDSKQQGEKRLEVSRIQANGEGAGKITLPKEENFTVTGEAIFPMRHQLRLMDAAAKGETRDTSLIYDGSEDTMPVRAITTIGRKIDAGTSKQDTANPNAADLQKLPSWPINIGYYKTDSNSDATPIYQISFAMYENGVSTGLVMDYGNFALSGKLAHLEFLKPEPCKPATP